MFSRAFSVLIVLFWVAMMGLLVRSEVWPDRSALRAVPVEYVAKLLWQHEQVSDLTVWNDGSRIGHLTLHPRMRKDDKTRLLEFSGNMLLRLPGTRRQRLSWDGHAEFDAASELAILEFGIAVREPSPMRADVTVMPAQKRARFRLTNGGREVESDEYSLDESGLKKLLGQLDLDPALYDTFRFSGGPTAVVSAQMSTMTIHHERIETYLVEVRQGGQTLLEAQVSQLGQLLRVRSVIGYTMAPDDLLP